MLISILFGGLGLAIMTGRYCATGTVLFSQSTTKREENLTRLLMKDEMLLAKERNPEDSSLLINNA
ncbi:hypothetical protein [uncultured Legionella sp.]|uniref:hypothetical protein n=1 Tax=uncultured Legionella sp. TaxID=210934 RepID=UPI002625C178|nr:hypothetical protein [uncultured Legionella sp.]